MVTFKISDGQHCKGITKRNIQTKYQVVKTIRGLVIDFPENYQNCRKGESLTKLQIIIKSFFAIFCFLVLFKLQKLKKSCRGREFKNSMAITIPKY